MEHGGISFELSHESTNMKPAGEHQGAKDNVSQNVDSSLACDNLEAGNVERGDAVS